MSRGPCDKRRGSHNQRRSPQARGAPRRCAAHERHPGAADDRRRGPRGAGQGAPRPAVPVPARAPAAPGQVVPKRPRLRGPRRLVPRLPRRGPRAHRPLRPRGPAGAAGPRRGPRARPARAPGAGQGHERQPAGRARAPLRDEQRGPQGPRLARRPALPAAAGAGRAAGQPRQPAPRARPQEQEDQPQQAPPRPVSRCGHGGSRLTRDRDARRSARSVSLCAAQSCDQG